MTNTDNPTLPPFAYYGGKTRIADRIVTLLPAHEHYVEPFAKAHTFERTCAWSRLLFPGESWRSAHRRRVLLMADREAAEVVVQCRAEPNVVLDPGQVSTGQHDAGDVGQCTFQRVDLGPRSDVICAIDYQHGHCHAAAGFDEFDFVTGPPEFGLDLGVAFVVDAQPRGGHLLSVPQCLGGVHEVGRPLQDGEFPRLLFGPGAFFEFADALLVWAQSRGLVLLVCRVPVPTETNPGDVDEGSNSIGVIEGVAKGEGGAPGVPEYRWSGQLAVPANSIEIGDRPCDRVGTATFGPAAAALIPADDPDLIGERRRQRLEHVPQAGAAVAHDQWPAASDLACPQTATVVRYYVVIARRWLHGLIISHHKLQARAAVWTSWCVGRMRRCRVRSQVTAQVVQRGLPVHAERAGDHARIRTMGKVGQAGLPQQRWGDVLCGEDAFGERDRAGMLVQPIPLGEQQVRVPRLDQRPLRQQVAQRVTGERVDWHRVRASTELEGAVVGVELVDAKVPQLAVAGGMQQPEQTDDAFPGIDVGAGPSLQQPALLGDGEDATGEPGTLSRTEGRRGVDEDQFAASGEGEVRTAMCGTDLGVGDQELLECRDALDVIADYGREPAALIYADPPYLSSTRQPGRYRVEMADDDAHRALADALHACRAAVVLSGYPSPLYDQLYAGWHRATLPATTAQGGRAAARTEVLWSNRPLTEQAVLWTSEATA